MNIEEHNQANIAQEIVELCGGVDVVAKWVKRTQKSIYCWGYPKDRGGCGGTIPAKYHSLLIDKANENGIELTHDMFFPKKEKKSA